MFVLIRPQKDASCEVRLEKEVINNSEFDRLRKKRGLEFTSFLQSKLQAVSGDVTLSMLGLGPDDQQLLQENVDITIHSAATVQFNEPLDVAVKMNCVGATNMREFVKMCPHLLCHLHVFTAYVSSSLRELQVREELVPLAFNPEDAVKAVLSASDNQLEQLQYSLMGNFFNTYVLTKSMAEHLIIKCW